MSDKTDKKQQLIDFMEKQSSLLKSIISALENIDKRVKRIEAKFA